MWLMCSIFLYFIFSQTIYRTVGELSKIGVAVRPGLFVCLFVVVVSMLL